MPAPPLTTLLEIVNTVAQSVGHPATTSVANAQDEAILRLGYYANLAGGELLYMNNWEMLSQTAIINIVADTAAQREKAFDLPADFRAMTDDTQWNRATQLPAIGPVNPQDWQWLVVRDSMITTRFLWRIRQGKLWVKSPPPPPNGQDLSFEYLSKNWAVSGADDTPKQVMVQNEDYHIYDPNLMILYTRVKWFMNEGYDATAAQEDFDRAFRWISGTDKGATSLSIVPGVGYPYVNAIRNIPDTGFGSAY
jgi:hypothetical protein